MKTVWSRLRRRLRPPRRLSFTREGRIIVFLSVGVGFAAINTGNNLLYLPLDKLMQQGGSAMPSEAQASQRPSPTEPAPPEASPRSRDTLRNRERGER